MICGEGWRYNFGMRVFVEKQGKKVVQLVRERLLKNGREKVQQRQGTWGRGGPSPGGSAPRFVSPLLPLLHVFWFRFPLLDQI